MKVVKRQTNIELLRIISILLIISFHYVYKSGYVFNKLNYNSYIVKMFYFNGELGVNLFILITGYFMIKGKFRIKKLFKLIGEVLFYTIILFVLAYILKLPKYNPISFDMIMRFYKRILSYWFFVSYLLLYIFSPYLNKLLNSINKKTFKKLLLVSIFIWSFIPTIFGFFENSSETLLFYNRFIWMIVVYSVGAYIRLYGIKIFEKKKNYIITAIASYLFMLISIFIIYKFKKIFLLMGTKEVAYFWPPNTIPMILLSVSIFYIFLNIKMKYSKIINLLSTTTLGIYLLHDGILQSYIWKNIFRAKIYLASNYSVLYILLATILVFLIGAIIDLIRQAFDKITLDKFLDSKIFTKISKKFNSFLNNILNIL